MSKEEKDEMEGMNRERDIFFGEVDIPLSEADQEALWDDYLDWCRNNENAHHE